jgi:2',3'-cyclic-nucleotide 2'-phosphodiesterase / 3'-nucleotidase
MSRLLLLCALITLVSCASTPAPSVKEGSQLKLALMETTDLHSNVRSFDYYRLTEDKSIGFERVASLIEQVRSEYRNTLLFDNGDTIQGTALADYQAMVQPLACDETLAMYQAMNAVGYDAGGVGNHEFNYGLSYLSQITGNVFDISPKVGERPLPTKACAGPTFPIVLANILSLKSKQPLFKPYVVLSREFQATAPDGSVVKAPIKIGVIGFTPPKVMEWDKRWLEGVVTTEGAVEAAQRYIPEMKAQGADVVIIISHSGLDQSPYTPKLENANWHLAKLPNVDALLMGHSHQAFPNAQSTLPQFNLPGVDKVKGTVHGVPAVMPNFWGKSLGVIELNLVQQQGRWQIQKEQTQVALRHIQGADKVSIEPAAPLAALIAKAHDIAVDYVKKPIGQSDFLMSSYFADVGDVSALQIVNQAQTAYVAQYVKDKLPQFASLPVLSVASPFKTGFAGSTDFTEVAAGELAINNAADLYIFPNTLFAVKVTGLELHNWLETASRRFAQINPALTTPQLLTTTVPGYNFDSITHPDFRYEIDVSAARGSRIVGLTYQGKPIDPKAEFIVATNNYRANGGGQFPGIDASKILLAADITNREVLIDYVRSTRQIKRATHADQRSWSFKKLATQGPVTFKSARGKLAVAQAAGLNNISVFSEAESVGAGMALYQIDLSK